MKAVKLTALMVGAMMACGVMTNAEETKENKQAVAKTNLQTTCPVMGGEINKNLYYDYKGKRIYVCCSGCVESLKNDPEKYIAKLEKSGVIIEKIKTDSKQSPQSSKDKDTAGK